MSLILPRLLSWDLAEIVEILPWCLQWCSHDVCDDSRWDMITEISPRLPISRWDMYRSCHDVWEILNLGEISARYPPSHRDYLDLDEICRDLAMFVSFWASVRSWRDFLHLFKIAEISQWCLWVSQILVKFAARFSTSRQDWQDLSVKLNSFSISERSCRDFERDKLLTEIAKSVYMEIFLAKCKTWALDEHKPFHDIRFEVKL